MEITDPAEIKLIEKYRECLEKAERAKLQHGYEGSKVGRSWSFPSQIDSDETRMVGVTVSIYSLYASESRATAEVELRKSGVID